MIGSCVRLRPAYKDHVWSYDFVHARTHDGRPLRMLTLIDEFTRECLAIDVERRMTSEQVLERSSARTANELRVGRRCLVAPKHRRGCLLQ